MKRNHLFKLLLITPFLFSSCSNNSTDLSKIKDYWEYTITNSGIINSTNKFRINFTSKDDSSYTLYNCGKIEYSFGSKFQYDFSQEKDGKYLVYFYSDGKYDPVDMWWRTPEFYAVDNLVMPFSFESAKYDKKQDVFVIDEYQYNDDDFPLVKFEGIQVKFKDYKLQYIYYSKMTDKKGKIYDPVLVSFSNWDSQTVNF